MDRDLADRLIRMAAAEETAVGDLFQLVVSDTGAAAAFTAHVGWHPSQDPVEIWASAGRAPDPAWMVDWPDPPPAVRRLRLITAEHAAGLAGIVDEHGWPGRVLVGEDASDAAWFVAMHADGDRALQSRCVDLLAPAVAAGDADPRHLATLADRVTSASDGEQVYGTLALLRGTEPTFLVPVRGSARLNPRRAAIGLPAVDDDLDEDAGRGQLPYRHLRQTPLYSWPPSAEARR